METTKEKEREKEKDLKRVGNYIIRKVMTDGIPRMEVSTVDGSFKVSYAASLPMFTILDMLSVDDEMMEVYARVVLNNILSVATISDPIYQREVFEVMRGYIDSTRGEIDDEEDKRIIEEERKIRKLRPDTE